MFCQNCGTENIEEATFCESCGAKLEKPDTKIPSSQNQTAFTAQKVMSRKSRMNKKDIILIAMAAIAIFLCYECKVLVENYTTPEYIAKCYFKDVMSGNSDDAFAYLDVEESDFVNKDYFSTVVENIGCKSITNFKVKESYTEKGKKGFGADVDIIYHLKEDASDYTFSVQLEKQPEKKWFFFDTWKVNAGDLVCKEIVFSVPKDSKTMVANIELTSKQHQKGTDANYDTYLIDKMFVGTYQVLVNKEKFDEYEGYVNVESSEDSFYVDPVDLVVASSAVDEVTTQAMTDYKAILNSIKDNKSYPELKKKLPLRNGVDFESSYADFVETFALNEYGEGITKFHFGKFIVTAQEDDYAGDATVSVYFYADCDYDYATANWWTDEFDIYNYTTSVYNYLTYSYLDGTWKIIDYSLGF